MTRYQPDRCASRVCARYLVCTVQMPVLILPAARYVSACGIAWHRREYPVWQAVCGIVPVPAIVPVYWPDE